MSASDPPVDLPGALIFRKRLLPWSETFIAAQGRALRRYHPVFVGYERVESGARYLEGADQLILREHSSAPALSKGALKALGIVTPRWRRALAARNPAVLHAHFGVNAADGLRIARTFRVPMVVTFHGMDIAVERKGAQLRTRRRVFREAGRILAVSRFIADRLLEAGCPPEKLTLHHIGVDTDRFAPGDPAGRRPSEVLFVGRLVAKKGAIHLVRAMRAVQEAVPEAEAVFAGDGSRRIGLEEEAARLGVRCRFLGIQAPDEVRALMRRATVLCAPSVVAADGNAEGLPITIMEAQASGLPVVAFPSGGSAEGLVHERTGFLAPPGDEDALARGLVRLLTDAEVWRRFSQAARAYALAEFDLARQTAELERIYDAVRGS